MAPVKDHNLCRASMTTKNWYGLLGGRRNQFHQDIHGIIADLALMMRPTFVLLDGTRVLFRSGPTGGSLADVQAGAHDRGLDRLARRRRVRLGRAARAHAASRSRRTSRSRRRAASANPDWKAQHVKEVQVG